MMTRESISRKRRPRRATQPRSQIPTTAISSDSVNLSPSKVRFLLLPSLHLLIVRVRAGGILTVADDLLKNDGQKFLEMMEQLADKRIQREREAADSVENEDEDGSDEEEYDEDDEDDE
jgi:hypothetical protein